MSPPAEDLDGLSNAELKALVAALVAEVAAPGRPVEPDATAAHTPQPLGPLYKIWEDRFQAAEKRAGRPQPLGHWAAIVGTAAGSRVTIDDFAGADDQGDDENAMSEPIPIVLAHLPR